MDRAQEGEAGAAQVPAREREAAQLDSSLIPSPGPSSRAWSVADIRLLQRTAGNAAVARRLQEGRRSQRGPPEQFPSTSAAAVGPASIQRRLAFGPQQLGKGRAGKTYSDIRARLEQYGKARSTSDQLKLLADMQKLIDDWRAKHKQDKSEHAKKHRKRLDVLEQAITLELKDPQVEYIKDMLSGGFLFASTDAQAERVAAADLIRGIADPLKTEEGRDAKALRRLEKHPLTEAELLALKVYSVGDYAIINPTLEGTPEGRKRLEEHLPRLGGQPSAVAWSALRQAGPQPDKTALKQLRDAWETKRKAYEAAAAAVVAQTDFEAVKTDARRHATMLISALTKLPAEPGRTTYRGMRLTWKEFEATWKTKNTVVTWNSFLSTSKRPAIAEEFASKTWEDNKLGVLLICNLKTARDVAKLTVHRREMEMMMLPGARLHIDRVSPPMFGKKYDREVEVTEV